MRALQPKAAMNVEKDGIGTEGPQERPA